MLSCKGTHLVHLILIVLAVLFLGTVQAGVPHKINYQGKLADSATGEPEAGTHTMVFRIYDDPGAGALLWSESQMVQADSAGVFSAVLGQTAPVDISLDGPVWLEVEVGGEVLVPRREIVSVPFAFLADMAEQALDADTVDGLNADAFADTGHMHDVRYYIRSVLNTPGAINDGSNPVDWTKLKGVPVDFADGVDDIGGVGDGHSLDAADGSPADAVFVDDEGNVGVGELSPGSKLDVDGSVNLTGHLKMDQRTVLSTDGLFSLRLGWAAGPNSTGDFNTFLGCRAGSSNTEGYHNTFVGFEAGGSNTSGTVNTFVGHAAGRANTTGGANTYVGYTAGSANITGRWNTCFGYFTGWQNTTGEGNTFLGTGAGYASLDGSNNCFVGRATGYENTSGSQNTFLGNFSGFSNTAGHRNVFVGYEAGYNETGSDKLYIANGQDVGDVLIYGDFAAGRVGINTMSPEEALDVNGAARITAAGSPLKLRTEAGYIELESDNPDPMGLRLSNAHRDWYLINGTGLNDRLSFYDGDAGKERLVIAGPTGRVGIGVSNPLATLTINDNIGGAGLTYPGIMIGNEGGESTIALGSGASNWCYFGWYHPDLLEVYSSGSIMLRAGSHRLMLTGDGEVGIGTDDPAEELHIVGDNPRILVEAETSNPEVNFKSTGDTSTEIWALYKESSNDDLYFVQDGAISLALKNSTGSVGIGTHNVGSYKLYVQGEAYSTVAWSSSDRRFKTEIGGIECALERLLGLRGVSFKWRREEYADRGFPEGEHFGVIAQDAEGVLPQIVKDGPDGEKSVAYAEIIPVLIESIRELKAENDALKGRIAALEVSRD
jgi:hypothetical protein